MTTLVSGHARGRLLGGNLCLMAHLTGTPYAPDLRGAILFLEDVDEPYYRIDRFQTQLWLSGSLEGVAGVAFGKFTAASRRPPSCKTGCWRTSWPSAAAPSGCPPWPAS